MSNSAGNKGIAPLSLPSILLVDDEQDILAEYQQFLEFEGFHALTCSDVKAAAAMVLQEAGIRLVITDLRMAGMDGAGLIKTLRAAVPAERQLNFIILTGDITHERSIELLDVPVFFKPPDTDDLLAAIRSALACEQ